MEKLDKYIDYIETVLVNKNIDNEDIGWKQNSELLNMLNSSEDICIIDSLTVGIDVDELLLLIKINAEAIDENFMTNIKKSIESEIQRILNQNRLDSHELFGTINLLFFVSTIHARLSIKTAFLSKNSMDLIKNIRTITRTKNSKLNPIFYLDKDISSEEIKLPNIRRYEMVTLPPFDMDIDVPKNNEKSTLKGYVFTANLFDLVSLYNTIGDQLFKKNVRLGIDDKLDVDKSIKETLKDKPEAFWFRNNGITILVEDTKMKLDRVGEIILKEADNIELNFSVINGAQTITAASEYYYALSDQDRNEKSSVAKVIVKIIHIRDEDSKRAEKEAKNISVSLNRQKPIKAEDIAFTNEFVETMNDYLELSKAEYTLARRGEALSSNKAYSLISFAKARKACSGDPGAARSAATATLLKITVENSQFQDEEIFKPEWYSATDAQKKEYYKIFYSPILFAMEMATSCQSIAKKTKLDGAVGNVIKNGMWYFIAYVVYLLNDGNDTNYSNFTYSFDKITPNILKLLFEAFATFYCHELKANETDTISNAFKTSDNYKILKKVYYKETPFYQYLCQLFDKKETLLHKNSIKTSESEVQKKSKTTSSRNNEVQVIFEGVPHTVSSVSSAFVFTVKLCLEKASLNKRFSAIEKIPFLTKDDSLETGYFGHKESIVVKDETILVGKQSSVNKKIKQMQELCDYIGISSRTILWKNKDSIIFEY